MTVVLLPPPIQGFWDTALRLQPLGPAYLKATVEKRLPGVAVAVRGFRHGRGRRTVSLPRESAHLRKYYPFPDRSPFATFQRLPPLRR